MVSVDQMPEARRALATPLFADLAGDAQVSFEFFPPKTEKMEETLWESVQTLAPLGPRFVSVTYGAGGSTRERTHATVARIARETRIPAAAHLTCVEATQRGDRRGRRAIIGTRACATSSRCAAIRRRRARSSRRIPAAMRMRPIWSPGCKQARTRSRFRSRPIPNAIRIRPTCAADLDNLKRKIDAGATRAITQFFLEAETFFRFRDAAAAAGIDAEIVPGIMPVTNFASVQRMSAMCGTAVPSWMDRLFEGLDDHPAARQLVAGDGRGRTVPPALRGRGAQFPFLHAQPRRAELRDLPSARDPRRNPHCRRRRHDVSPRTSCSARSRQAHPDHRRRVRHRDPELEAVRGRLCRRPRAEPRPEGQ